MAGLVSPNDVRQLVDPDQIYYGSLNFFCKGAVEDLVSDALEYMYSVDPDKALLTLTGLLVKISKWHQLYHEKVIH